MKASYKYQAEDSDELNFEVGELINVVAYEDPEDQVTLTYTLKHSRTCKTYFGLALRPQEEGWLMGVKEATGDKGMFPANFTRPI